MRAPNIRMKTVAAALAITGSLLIGAGLMVIQSEAPAEAGDVARVEELLSAPSPPSGQGGDSGPSIAPAAAASTETSPPVASGPRFSIASSTLPKAREVVPTSLQLGTDVKAPIVLAGVEANGEMEVPNNVTDVAWYRFGPAPGEDGSAVLAAHVDLAGQGAGVFFGLNDLPIGSLVEVGFSDGTVERFRTFARAQYEKDELPTDLIFSRSGSPVLTLITCGGSFNPSLGRYDSNVVVYASPVEAVEQPGELE